MSWLGSTGGGPGAYYYNLSLAQFNQRVATATRKCIACRKQDGKSSKRYCKALIAAKFYDCAQQDGLCGPCPNPKKLADAAAREGCRTRVPKPCDDCDCHECHKSCDDKSYSSSWSKSCKSHSGDTGVAQ